MFIARFDGGCDPNPGGHASCACLIEKDGEEIYRESKYLGYGPAMTCNVAEYHGLMLILKWFSAQEHKEFIHIISDSTIVIRRMTGKARKNPVGICAPLAIFCLEAAMPVWKWLSFEWQPREENGECDAMCDLEIDEVVFSEDRF